MGAWSCTAESGLDRNGETPNHASTQIVAVWQGAESLCGRVVSQINQRDVPWNLNTAPHQVGHGGEEVVLVADQQRIRAGFGS